MEKASSFRVPLVLIAASFLLWGTLRSLDDILAALFSASGTIHHTATMLIHLSFFSGYLLVSVPTGVLLRRRGYGNALSASLCLMGSGAALCAWAMWTSSFPVYLTGVFLAALGIAALQTIANPLIGLLGSEQTATARLLLVQGFVSLGCVLGPLGGSLLFGRWKQQGSSTPLSLPTGVLSAIYASLAVALATLIPLIHHNFPSGLVAMRRAGDGHSWRLIRYRRVLFGVSAVFLYVGSETTILSTFIRYLSGDEATGILPGVAATLLSAYWASVLLCRLLAAGVLRRIDTRTLMQVATVAALLLVQIGVFRGGLTGGVCLLCTGFFNAVLFPSIFTLSVSGLTEGELPHASALLSTAIFGGAVMPLLSGLLAERLGIAWAFVLPSIAYVYIGLGSAIFFPRDFQLQRDTLQGVV